MVNSRPNSLENQEELAAATFTVSDDYLSKNSSRFTACEYAGFLTSIQCGAAFPLGRRENLLGLPQTFAHRDSQR